MYKNMIKGMIIGGSLLGLVASAQAANQTYEYNIYKALPRSISSGIILPLSL